MSDASVPPAPRSLTAAGLALMSAFLTAGAVLGGAALLALRDEPGEDWAALTAFLFAPPAQLLGGGAVGWHVLRHPSTRPLRAWLASVGVGAVLLAVEVAILGPSELLKPRAIGLAAFGLVVGGVVPAVAARNPGGLQAS